MKVAILIQAHKNPEQCARLVDRVSCKNTDVFINIDKKTDITPFKKEIKNAHFIKNRVPIYWSNISQVQGMLNSFREILNLQVHYDYFIFLSGQDYPLKPIAHIVEFLEINRGKEFIECRKVAKDDLNWEKRFNKYHCTHLSKNTQFLFKLLRQLPFPNRRYPLFKNIYGGSAWIMLTGDAIRYVLNFCDEHPDFVAFHKFAHCPDEYFFQTILMNSPFQSLIINNNFWYIDWSNQDKNPKILGEEDYVKFIHSEKLFARKFELPQSQKVMRMIDQYRADYNKKPLYLDPSKNNYQTRQTLIS